MAVDRQTVRQTDQRKDRQTDNHTGRQTDRRKCEKNRLMLSSTHQPISHHAPIHEAKPTMMHRIHKTQTNTQISYWERSRPFRIQAFCWSALCVCMKWIRQNWGESFSSPRDPHVCHHNRSAKQQNNYFWHKNIMNMSCFVHMKGHWTKWWSPAHKLIFVHSIHHFSQRPLQRSESLIPRV